MNPILASKAKEMYWSIIQHWCGAPAEYEDPIVSKRFDEWLRTKSAAAILLGEDWKEDGKDAIEFGKWLNIHCKVRQTTDGGITWLYYRDGDLKPMGKFFTDELYKEYRKSSTLPEPPKP